MKVLCFFSSRRRHTRYWRDWSSDVCSSDLGVRLRFEGGRVVEASAEKGEEFLNSMLEADEGARYLGEIGIGTNYRSEERRVGKECRSRWSPYHSKNTQRQENTASSSNRTHS